MSSARRQVAVVVGATSKWQADGRNTKLAHGKVLDDRDMPVGIRWGVGGAIAQKFAKEGFFVVLTTRHAANASALEKAIVEQGGAEHGRRAGPGVGRESICTGVRHDSHRPSVTRMCWSTTPATWRGVTCRRKRSYSSTSPSTYSTPRSTSPAVDRSWLPQEVLPAMRAAGRRLVPLFEQRVLLARTQAPDRTVAVLSARDDAHAGAGADGGILRAWRARGQRRDRRPHRLAGHQSPAESPDSIPTR